MKMTIEFLEPDRLHANSDISTTADIAIFLEAKYNLIENFTKAINAKLMARITKVINRFIESEHYKTKSLEKMLNQQVGGWLQNEWRTHINNESHGIKTQNSIDDNRQAFVDTGDYFKSMIAHIRVK